MRRGLHRAERSRVGCRGLLGQHVLRQREDHGSRAAGRCDVEGTEHVLGDPISGVDLRHPLGDRREHLPELHFLERLAAAHVALHLADEQDHRRRILIGRVYADARMRPTGAARDEADSGSSRQLAIRFCHVGGGPFVLRDDDLDLRRVVKRVQHVEIAFAGYAEKTIDAVDAQRVNEDPPSRAGSGTIGHWVSSSANLKVESVK